MKSRLFLYIILLFASTSMAQQKSVGQISIKAATELNAREKVAARMTTDGYDGLIGIKLRGNSSLGFAQKKYTLETWDADAAERPVSLLGMPAHSDWVLLAPYNDVSMLRDPLAFQLWREMGHWAPRTRFVELTFNGDYRGIYILAEAIKQGADRVDISRMTTTDTCGRNLTGGYLLRIDTFNEDDATFTSSVPGIGEGSMTSEVIWSCIYPKKKKLMPEQLEYIQSFVDTVEQVIQSDLFADRQNGYARYIDVPSFVDYFIHTELSLNADGYKRSAYFYKERQRPDGSGGRLVAGPVWDYNLAYGNCNFANANNLEAWCFKGASNNPTPAMWQRLLQDPAFRKAVKKRYFELRKNVLSNKSINAYIDRQAQLLSEAANRHFAVYPELLVSEEQKQQLADQRQQMGAPPFGGFPGMSGGFPPQGGFPGMGGGFPGAFPPQMGGGFSGGFPGMGVPPFGAFPRMGGFPGMGGFPRMGEFSPQMGEIPEGGFPDMSGFQFDAVGMFAAYRVSSYDEEIQTLKQWLADRLAFLDANIDRFDSDWQPLIQPLVEKKMQFPW